MKIKCFTSERKHKMRGELNPLGNGGAGRVMNTFLTWLFMSDRGLDLWGPRTPHTHFT